LVDAVGALVALCILVRYQFVTGRRHYTLQWRLVTRGIQALVCTWTTPTPGTSRFAAETVLRA
jgi:hypothetical protein